MHLTRTQILKGKYTYPPDMVKIWGSKHFLERLDERGVGLECIPTVVRVTPDNIHSARLENDQFVSVVVRLKYTSSKYIFLCFNPIDGNLKTLWFREKGKIYERGKVTQTDKQTV